MYELMTFDTIMGRMLERVPSTLDKREGSIIWDALAPAAIELQNLYVELDVILNETFADTASLFYLKKRAAERGIYQNMATRAVLQGEFTPTTLEIPVGSRFSCDTLNYMVAEKTEDGVYKLICETAGSEGNKHFGILIPIDHISGLESANLTDLLISAEDDEDVESLRRRYLNALSSQAYGGNIADYKEKFLKVQGVGGVKIIPVWNGGGTVKAVIINDFFGVPSSDLLTKAKNEADPYPNEGLGYGFAPIGHVVTVEGVTGQTINIETEITYDEGWSWEAAQSNIKTIVDDYFLELSKGWENNKNITVRISQLESRILECEGVLDITGTTLNGSTSNLSLDTNKIPVRGTINGN